MNNLKEKFALFFTNEPMKTFRQEGVVNGENQLTSDGRDLFLAFLLNKYGEEFKTFINSLKD